MTVLIHVGYVETSQDQKGVCVCVCIYLKFELVIL